MSTNGNTPISQHFWKWMQSYWHSNRKFPPAHPDWRTKADLVDGKVPAAQLPSYVDDVLEFGTYADLPQPGEKGKIYITTADNKQYRWSGTAFVDFHEGNLRNIVAGNNGFAGNFNNIQDPDITHKSGFYGADPNINLPEKYYTTWINVNSWAEHDNYGFQIAAPLFGNNIYFRKFTSTGYDRHTHSPWWKFWTAENFDPETKAGRENNAAGIGFDGGNIENPYMKHNSGAAFLATKSWATNTFIPKTHPVANIGQSQVDSWNSSIGRAAASAEVILKDDILTIQPDEFSLAGNSSYSIGSKKKRVHVLFMEGTELNIRELAKRQTIVVFNFSRSRINLTIGGLNPYPLSSEMQVTVYIDDQGEVLLYNETSFKKIQ